ncbi:hypothetical protein EDC04DRAFT_2611360 [Pisolithus marmoratus]|nr:hypothetical protein EDC04DRAFT_2611360 [Pisolithus marmoratus]
MDYQPYFPPITLRKVFRKECSPSPSSSEITAHMLALKAKQWQICFVRSPGMGDDMYDSVQKGLHLVCKKKMDMNSPYHLQWPESLSAFFEAAQEQFPILTHYQDSWPARDFAKMYLKNKVGSDKAKRHMRLLYMALAGAYYLEKTHTQSCISQKLSKVTSLQHKI